MDRQEEIQEYMEALSLDIDSLVQRRDDVAILGIIALSLEKIAVVQQEMLALAQADFEAAVSASVEERAEVLSAEIVEKKSRRSFIGKGD